MPVLMHFVSIFSNVFGDVWEEMRETTKDVENVIHSLKLRCVVKRMREVEVSQGQP